jgi:hypothetical protein
MYSGSRSNGRKREAGVAHRGARVPVIDREVTVLATTRTAFRGFPETTK